MAAAAGHSAALRARIHQQQNRHKKAAADFKEAAGE
jgi:hypothetical protein